MIISERELTPLVLNPPPNITKVIDEASENKLFEYLERTEDTGFDIETTPVDNYFWRRVRTIQFGTAKEQYVIDLKAYCDGDAELLYNCQGDYGKKIHLAPKLQSLINRLVPYLCSKDKVKTGVNLAFEYECFYWMLGVRIYGMYDCMMAEKCIYAGLGGHASLKNYEFYSMASMFERYFGKTIDKTLQTSFDLDSELTDAQFEYAALDTRIPLSIKTLQNIIASGETPKSLKAKGKPVLADYLYHLDDIIFGDVLHEIIGIENEAIGAFVDMHIHGERVDRDRWKARVEKSKHNLIINLNNLDKEFIPIVGSKNEPIDDALINALETEWKKLSENQTDQEINMKAALRPLRRVLKKEPLNDDVRLKVSEIEAQLSTWEKARKDQKDILKAQCSDLKKKRTKINKLKESCEGEALINYGSDAQLLKVLTDPDNAKFFPQIFTDERLEGKKTGKKKPVLEGLDDETLEKYENCPAIRFIREYHGLSKEIGTYGDSWATEWITRPCKEEGWLHPGDGRLHSKFNQLDAGTGRSSSSQPNGQNLPQDVEVRSCFVADPPNEAVRVSKCCCADTVIQSDPGTFLCEKCGKQIFFEETNAEEYVIVTADMSGAELRIIAEDANDPLWIQAFARGEDVHSVGTELLYEEEWHKEAEPGCDYFKKHTEETIAANPLCILNDAMRQKCNCSAHKVRRNHNKSTNFLLAYGGGPGKLATEIKKPLKEAKSLMALHEAKNPIIWQYLEESGRKAAMNFKAFDLFGRRRLLPEPTRPRAIENAKEWNEKELRLSTEQAQKNIETFTAIKGRKPKQDEEFDLTHRPPNDKEISRSYVQMSNSITRQGKNHRIQGTNATIAKKAMGAGYCPDGKPFLFHTLPLFRANLIKFVHDELVVQCPKQYGKQVAELIGDAFKRAAAIKMKKVVMEFDYHISNCWEK
jgi:DNA polymerase I-like protein with 3'-5' exonuclease and polymerase domains